MSNTLDSLIAGCHITVLERESSPYVSSSFHEVLTCRLRDGSVRRLLLKRGAARAEASYGNHGGVPYEVEIYRKVLEPLGVDTARLHDAFLDASSGETVMLIDYIERSERLSKSDASKLIDAARWIAAFHKLAQSRVGSAARSITLYDARYYSGWMRRTFEFWNHEHPWLGPLLEAWDELAAELQAGATIVHGEYYPKNVLVSGDRIVPIDWETAAVAAGEIDLAFLTERWPDSIQDSCELAYRQERWAEQPPANFSRRLLLANMYAQLLRLGNRKYLVSDKEAAQRLMILKSLGRKAGIVS